LRPDRLGCYGHPTNATPSIDRLAHEGTIFDRAYCDVPWTTGSMSSVMTGNYSQHHGLRLPADKLDPKALTLAEILNARGFQTGAIIGSFPLDSVYGLDQGFEIYDDEFTVPMIRDPGTKVAHVESHLPDDPQKQAEFILEKFRNDAYRPDEEVTDAAIRWLETRRDGRPFFLWVHYFGPHEKLEGDRGFVEQEPRIVAAYDGDVEANDRAVGRLLDDLRKRKILDDTLVILHSDHGQNLGENEYVGHSILLDDASVRIPLIVRYPRRMPARKVNRDIAHNIDIMPTILDVTGTEGIEGLEGRSLIPSWFGARAVDPLKQVAYFETYMSTIIYAPLAVRGVGTLLGPVERHGVRTPEWKLVEHSFTGACTWGGTPQRDPFGTWSSPGSKPLTAERCAELNKHELFRESENTGGRLEEPKDPSPDVLVSLRASIQKYSRRDEAATGGRFQLSPEQERKLKSLGYLQ